MFIMPSHLRHTHLSEADPVVVVVVEGALQVSCELGLVDVLQQGFQRRQCFSLWQEKHTLSLIISSWPTVMALDRNTLKLNPVTNIKSEFVQIPYKIWLDLAFNNMNTSLYLKYLLLIW